MTHRERWIETLLFGKPDRIPLNPGEGRKSTKARWLKEGLKEGADPLSQAYRELGGKLELPREGEGFPIDTKMRPCFEEKVLEVKADSQIVQDWKGNVCEIGLEFTPEFLRSWGGQTDFVTRRWIKCPVETHAGWDDMKRRYDADDPERYPKSPTALGKRLQGRDYITGVYLSGPFWQLREWLGFEGLCIMLHDDPDFVREMIFFWESYVAKILKHVFKDFTPDYVHISEDMAYKCHSMISIDMAREFLLPTWARWGEIVRKAGVPLYMMDSDGFIGELIPLWIEAGINVCDPMEVAAGNDINKFRREFGRKIAFRGGVDKREMAKGGISIKCEIERILPVIKDGGFIPGCDHGIPNDVSWPSYVEYIGHLAKATGWL